jgi:signal peptidase
MRRVVRALPSLGFAVVLVTAAAMLALPLMGYERYVITGGSMSGSIERGSVLFAKAVPTSDLKVGDVITYTPPRGSGPEGLVTHRIVAIRSEGGKRLYKTRGDANRSVDPWEFELPRPTQARAAFDVPYAGHVLNALSGRQVRMIAFGLPAAIIALMMVLRLWRDAGEAAREAAAQESVA